MKSILSTVVRVLVLSVGLVGCAAPDQSLTPASAAPTPAPKPAPRAGAWRKSKGRVLIVASSRAFYGDGKTRTGVWLAEVTHPYAVLSTASYDVDIASPSGGEPPIDPASDPRTAGAPGEKDLISRGFLDDPATNASFQKTKRLVDVNTADYAAVLFAGGSAAMFDLPSDPDVKRIVLEMSRAEKPIAAFCHGVSALLEVKREDGHPFVEGLTLTAFTAREEALAAKASGRDPSLSSPIGVLEEELKKRGAVFVSGPPFSSFVAVSADGRLLTGQQPYSGLALGTRLVVAIEQRGH
jgi:putative intracellular protease/amidase